jgi:hypothetical protein
MGSAQAQDAKLSDKQITAWNNVQGELTECIAYWQLAKGCAPENAKDEELKQVDRIIAHMDTLAFEVGKNIGMTDDAMVARLKIAFSDLAKLTDQKVCVNWPSLLMRYGQRCKLLGEHPEAVFSEYMSK